MNLKQGAGPKVWARIEKAKKALGRSKNAVLGPLARVFSILRGSHTPRHRWVKSNF